MDCDLVIIGAGVVGLAIAAKLGEETKNIFVLEQHESFGKETSSRNSEVIHAGIYYPAGSLKARLCVEGRERLYQICQSHQIPHLRIGKLIVAAKDEEISSLSTLKAKAEANGVTGMRLLDQKEIRKQEPHISAKAALLSPDTGIVDSHRLMKHFESIANAKGVSIVYGCKVTGIQGDQG